VKLCYNIGSGQRKFTTSGDHQWINVDINPAWTPDIVSAGENLAQHGVGDCTADIVVLHHVLEHYGCGEASALIAECKRILKPSGKLLIFVPDMNMLAKMWLDGRIDTQIYMTNVYGAYMNHEADRHKWGFDEGSLRSFIRTVDTKSTIFRYVPYPTPGADIAWDVWIIGIEVHFSNA